MGGPFPSEAICDSLTIQQCATSVSNCAYNPSFQTVATGGWKANPPATDLQELMVCDYAPPNSLNPTMPKTNLAFGHSSVDTGLQSKPSGTSTNSSTILVGGIAWQHGASNDSYSGL